MTIERQTMMGENDMQQKVPGWIQTSNVEDWGQCLKPPGQRVHPLGHSFETIILFQNQCGTYIQN